MTNSSAIDITIRGADGTSTSHHLDEGTYVLVGSSDVCGLTLKNGQLSPIHCALRWEANEFWVEDWNSDLGVFVDGLRVKSERRVPVGSEVRLGDYRVEIERHRADPPGDSAAAPQTSDSSATAAEPRQRSGTAPAAPPAAPPAATLSRTPSSAAKPQLAVVSPSPPPPEPGRAERGESETIEMLRAELEQLQYELAERDAQLAELTSLTVVQQDQLDDQDDVHLLSRLEELLGELDRGDERVALLEQLLQAAEEKIRADHEERRHLAEWVNDIEARLGEREAEWQAERDALSHRVHTALAERDEMVQHLSEIPAGQSRGELDPREVDQLRAKNVQLRQQLDDSDTRRTKLEEELRNRQQELSEQTRDAAALREEHLKLAQERATLARQQAEMTALRGEMETTPKKPENEIDCRLREFRQHLREIHLEEQQNPQTMSSRIARLWARVERSG